MLFDIMDIYKHYTISHRVGEAQKIRKYEAVRHVSAGQLHIYAKRWESLCTDPDSGFHNTGKTCIKPPQVLQGILR